MKRRPNRRPASGSRTLIDLCTKRPFRQASPACTPCRSVQDRIRATLHQRRQCRAGLLSRHTRQETTPWRNCGAGAGPSGDGDRGGLAAFPRLAQAAIRELSFHPGDEEQKKRGGTGRDKQVIFALYMLLQNDTGTQAKHARTKATIQIRCTVIRAETLSDRCEQGSGPRARWRESGNSPSTLGEEVFAPVHRDQAILQSHLPFVLCPLDLVIGTRIS